MRLLFVVLLLAIVLPLTAVAEETAARCETCGMNYDISPTRVEVTVELKVGPKTKSYTHIYECLNCSYRALTAKYGEDLNITGVQMLNYQTFGTKKETMIDGMKAVYLYGVKRMRATMAPFIVAYANESDAKSAQRVLDGELVTSFDDIWKMLEKHNAPEEEKADEPGHEGHNH